uniref:Uncharacterized protein n=1 Tax=Knipowitschia caucasica TaxID=637954 RepID=A0AAV2JL91_KNICA
MPPSSLLHLMCQNERYIEERGGGGGHGFARVTRENCATAKEQMQPSFVYPETRVPPGCGEAVFSLPPLSSCHWTPAFTKGTVAMGSTASSPRAPRHPPSRGPEPRRVFGQRDRCERLRYAITDPTVLSAVTDEPVPPACPCGPGAEDMWEREALGEARIQPNQLLLLFLPFQYGGMLLGKGAPGGSNGRCGVDRDGHGVKEKGRSQGRGRRHNITTLSALVLCEQECVFKQADRERGGVHDRK